MIVEVAEADVMCRETAGRHGGKRVSDGVEQAHAGRPVRGGAGHSETQIDRPQGARGLLDARRHLGVLDRPRRLGAQQLHATDTQQRQDRHGQNDDAAATQPLQLLTVVEDAAGQRVDTGQHRRARRRQPGNRLEHGLRKRHARCGRKPERQCAGHAEHGPEQGDHQEAIANLEVRTIAPHGYPHHAADRQRRHEAEHEGVERGIAVEH